MSFRRALAAFVPLIAACASPNATISVTVGDADAGTPGCTYDALEREPAVVTFELDTLQHGGEPQPIKTGTLAQASLDIGDVSQTEVASLQFVGLDASQKPLVFGATPFVELGALDGANIPLFVQRKGELACMPGTIADARTKPLLAATPRGIYYGGGTIAGASDHPLFGGYDLLFLRGFGSSCQVGVDAQSLSLVELTNVSSDGDSAAAALIANDAFYELGLPSCGFSEVLDKDKLIPNLTSFSQVAGGRSVTGDDGTGFIVGPSKLDAPSNVILALPPGGADGGAGSAVAGFASPRQGAAVAWYPNHGIFIYGGAADPKTAGVEIVPPSLGTPDFLPYPLEQVQNLAAVQFDASHMLVAGDTQPARLIDLACFASCAPAPWGQALPLTLASPSLFKLADGIFLIVGDDASGATHVFRLTATDPPREIQFKIPRQGARAVQTDTGEVIILGGGSDVPESYFD